VQNSKVICSAVVAASVIFVNGATSAADLPARIYSKAPPPVDRTYDWSGFYAGVNAGYAFDGRARDAITANDPTSLGGITGGFVPTSVSTRSDGFTGGGQIGYNYQFHNDPTGGVVIGLEADAAYMDSSRTSDTVTGRGFDTQFHSRLDFLGTVRGRLGYAFDQLLVYGTGGLAYGDVDNRMTNFNRVGVAGYTGSQDTMRTGYAYGGGVEYAMASNSAFNIFHASGVTLKVEYLHYDLGTSSFLSNSVPGVGGAAAVGSAFTNTVHTDGDLVRAGLNYKFGGPVFAKY
jgi:outer membrane immunogenic protein